MSIPYLALFNRLTVKKGIICDSSLIDTLLIIYFYHQNDVNIFVNAWLIISLVDPTLAVFIVYGPDPVQFLLQIATVEANVILTLWF